MASLRWAADGIRAAELAGGVIVERYRRPGFTDTDAVRVLGPTLAGGLGFEIVSDPEPYEDDQDFAARA